MPQPPRVDSQNRGVLAHEDMRQDEAVTKPTEFPAEFFPEALEAVRGVPPLQALKPFTVVEEVSEPRTLLLALRIGSAHTEPALGDMEGMTTDLRGSYCPRLLLPPLQVRPRQHLLPPREPTSLTSHIPITRYGLGNIYFRQEKFDFAEHHLRKALAIEDDDKLRRYLDADGADFDSDDSDDDFNFPDDSDSDAARRRADVVVSCRALTTGHATDVHGHVSAEHRTGRMATTTTNGSAAPRRVDARFRLTELGPKVTRVHV